MDNTNTTSNNTGKHLGFKRSLEGMKMSQGRFTKVRMLHPPSPTSPSIPLPTNEVSSVSSVPNAPETTMPDPPVSSAVAPSVAIELNQTSNAPSAISNTPAEDDIVKATNQPTTEEIEEDEAMEKEYVAIYSQSQLEQEGGGGEGEGEGDEKGGEGGDEKGGEGGEGGAGGEEASLYKPGTKLFISELDSEDCKICCQWNTRWDQIKNDPGMIKLALDYVVRTRICHLCKHAMQELKMIKMPNSQEGGADVERLATYSFELVDESHRDVPVKGGMSTQDHEYNGHGAHFATGWARECCRSGEAVAMTPAQLKQARRNKSAKLRSWQTLFQKKYPYDTFKLFIVGLSPARE